MARFCGNVGYARQVETVPGVWTDQIVERKYYGDFSRNEQRWQSSEYVNEKFNIDNAISIIADPYAYENLQFIVYVEFMGVKWKVQSLMINRPRIVLQLGGLYNKWVED